MSREVQASEDPGHCHHSEVEDLGTDNLAEFYRCRRCGSVIVVQESRQWTVTA